MPTTKKKKSTKTAKKVTATKARRKSTNKTCRCKGISSHERNHVCCVAALSIAVGILLCIDAAMMIVA